MAHKKGADDSSPVIIKKYANRRLYNTETSSYITLELLSQMTREGREFLVVDAKTNEDITHNVLTQIIMEEEQRGENMLPVSFLRSHPARSPKSPSATCRCSRRRPALSLRLP